MIRHRTYRMVDGERVEGTLIPAMICNGGMYFLTELGVYADGVIDCWGMTDLDGLLDKLASGWVATSVPEGATGSFGPLVKWKFSDPRAHVAPEDLYGEVVDLIEELNGRPTSRHRCREAIDRFMASGSEADRLALCKAYRDIPDHEKRAVLGDMDSKDAPLKAVLEFWPTASDPDGPAEKPARLQWVLDYFAERESWAGPNRPYRPSAPDEAGSGRTAVRYVLPPSHSEARSESRLPLLHNHAATPLRVDGIEYPTVEHAYWSAFSTEPSTRAKILAEPEPRRIRKTAAETPERPAWHRVRDAVMLRLLRAKFAANAEAARALLDTGDSRLHYNDASDHWGVGEHGGSNWMGRLLELVRAELLAEAIGIPASGQ